MSEWKINIKQNPWGAYIDLYFYRRRDHGTEVMTWDSNGNQILLIVSEGQATDGIKPTLRLNSFDSTALLKSLADAINNYGVKTDSDARISGLLEATKEHLADMRKLVFEPLKRGERDETV